ncbi:hypothetical protein [Rhodoferax antarcticus]|uniref:FlgN family protein n=1 Tax=Rhodoferax antarcticus ANT.BR TaxID=1111071 RepID=A0A1Q8YGJ2_9BURK|nr:hypothetical protein [Rhodoferax antarcticus]APW45600.1 hypothetical protein RA876_03535 [Rhodoferax antarcticus]OLP07087.1 hypothetical protein BLL52_1838 [Rhodoferax antarcticus ANT.BR]
MASNPLQSSLEIVETHIHQISQQLLEPDSGELLQASTDLQAVVLELSRLVQRTPAVFTQEPSLKLRMRTISVGLASCRETLLRRAFITQSALSTLMPATRDTIYAPAMGKYSRQPYGSAGRQSGEFRVISA